MYTPTNLHTNLLLLIILALSACSVEPSIEPTSDTHSVNALIENVQFRGDHIKIKTIEAWEAIASSEEAHTLILNKISSSSEEYLSLMEYISGEGHEQRLDRDTPRWMFQHCPFQNSSIPC